MKKKNEKPEHGVSLIQGVEQGQVNYQIQRRKKSPGEIFQLTQKKE